MKPATRLLAAAALAAATVGVTDAVGQTAGGGQIPALEMRYRDGAVAPVTLRASTRIVPLHVYVDRQNTTGFVVPYGYRAAWEDDRLNPYRAERSLQPRRVPAGGTRVHGYQNAWADDRLNPSRGGTTRGDAQSDLIWTREVPRTLMPVPTTVPVLLIEKGRSDPSSGYWNPQMPDSALRLSTRSQPVAAPEIGRR